MTGKKSKIRGWLQLLRAPNLFSVPGDPLAGFLLAAGGMISGAGVEAALLAASGVFAYIFGLVTNDLADLETDCMERPDRPIPAGMVSPRAAVAAAIVSALLTLLFAAIHWLPFCVAMLLIYCVWRYNFHKNKDGGRGRYGLFLMASCRFLNVALGMAGAVALLWDRGSVPDWKNLAAAGVFAAGEFLYIYGLSAAALDETKILPRRPGRWIFFPGALLMYGTLFSLMAFRPVKGWFTLSCGVTSALSAGVFLVLAYWCFRLFRMPVLPRLLQGSIGLLIFALIFAQAAAVSAKGGLVLALALLAGAVLSRFAAKKFYAS